MTADKIAADAVTTDRDCCQRQPKLLTLRILNDAVTANRIADAAVLTAKIADNAVNATKLNVTGDGTNTQFLQSDGDGSFTWNVPTDTTYTAGTGLGLTGTAFSLDLANDQTWTGSQRGTTTTDNDLSFDMNVTNNFSCTPSTGATLTFTNHTAGQSGYVLLDNTAGVAITAHANTKINATDLATISTAGVYLVSYFDNGTNAYITVSAAYP